MRILIVHRIPYGKIDYARGIDHEAHEVTYVGTEALLATIPAGIPCSKVARPGIERAAVEVPPLFRGEARFERVISLSEYELLDAAEIREALGAPGPRRDEVLRVRDKLLMKEAVRDAGLRVPEFEPCAGAGAQGRWQGPTVVKPVDGASSENVLVYPSRREALSAVRSGTIPVPGFDPGRFEMEEYVDGPILHIDGLVHDGSPVIMLASRYLGTCLEYARGQALASVQMEPDAALLGWAARAIRAVGIRSGAFHLEAILGREGPVFLEIANRVGGADVVDTFELATGIHLPSEELKLIVEGRPSDWLRAGGYQGFRRKYGWFVFPGHQLPSGPFEISGTEWLGCDPRIVRWNQLRPGDSLPRRITYQWFEAPVAGIAGADSTDELERLMRRIMASVRIERKQTEPVAV